MLPAFALAVLGFLVATGRPEWFHPHASGTGAGRSWHASAQAAAGDAR